MILKVLPAFDNTFVIMAIDRPGYGEFITHVTAEGKELFIHEAKDTINVITMTNDSTVVYCEIKENKIILVDLKKKVITSLNHNFMSDCTAALGLYYFS